MLREALALWRGPPLADLAFEPFAQAEIARLEEQRLDALEERVEADLAAGRHAALVGELRQLVVDHPTRERLAGQLMLALYRCGQQADALEAFHAARRVLVAEIGVEPGPELRRLEQAILRHDVALELRAPEAELPPRARSRSARRRSRAGRPSSPGCASAGTARAPATARSSRWSASAGSARRGSPPSWPARSIAAGRRSCTPAARSPRTARSRRCVEVRAATRPTLLVLDDADQASAAVLAELAALGSALAGVPAARAGDGCRGGGARCARRRRVARARGARRRGGARRERRVRPEPDRRGGAGRAPAAGQRRRAAPDPRGRRPVGAARGGAQARGRSRSAPRSGAPSCARWRSSWPATSSTSRRCATPSPTARSAEVCPFKGLATFGAADAEYFFGRERLVAELVARLVGAPLLAIVGPSGSGKSSVAASGLAAGPRQRRAARQRELGAGRHPAGRSTRDASSPPPSRGSPPPSASCSPSTSSRRRSRSAATRTSATPSSPSSSGSRATGAGSSCSPSAPTPTGAAPRTRRSRACSPQTTCSSGRCDATSCGGRSRARRGAPTSASSPSSTDALVRRRRGRAGRAAPAVDGAARALAAARRTAPAARRLRAHRRRARRGRAARRGRLRPARPGAPARRARRRHAARGPGSRRRRRAPAGPDGGVRSRRAATTSRAVLALFIDRRLLTVERGDRRGRARGAAARVAAAGRLDRGGPRRAAHPARARRRGAGVAAPRSRRRRAVPRVAPHRDARLARRAGAVAQRARARVPGRERGGRRA